MELQNEDIFWHEVSKLVLVKHKAIEDYCFSPKEGKEKGKGELK
jgi:hypothetical protein